ncbi:MAG: hypothetical protein RMK32_04275 [Anaerolineae bacterium]|nr:hypothetical protein [Thermoflexus sp.]MDW8064828.1 hypothetical protein [Anaerolineae bacterium]
MEHLDRWEPLRAYREDRTSGAMALAFRATQILEEWAQNAPIDRMKDFCSELEALLHALTQAHPDMAPPWHLAESARQALQKGMDPAAARAALISTARKFRDQLEAHAEAAAWHAASLIRTARTIVTHSRSGLVARSLAFAAEKGHRLRVICPVAEPGGEGRHMAEEIAAMGHISLLLPDLVAMSWISHADLILIGADAWDEEGIVNKVGTLVLAVLAQLFQRPFFAIAISEKRWPLHVGPHPTRAVPPSPPCTESIPWFEFVPRSYLTGLILEDGVRLAK